MHKTFKANGKMQLGDSNFRVGLQKYIIIVQKSTFETPSRWKRLIDYE